MNKFKHTVSAFAALASGHADAAVSEMPADPSVAFAMQVVGFDDEGNEIVVTGDDDDEVEGSVMGSRRRRGGGMVRVRRPGWRNNQLAPGVIAPDEGLLPLPLNGITGNVFSTATATASQITFQGQIQKPFRGERLLVSTVRTGASAVGRLLSQLFVGTDLQQLDIGGFDAEQVGTPTAFGVRLTMKPAQPGVFIRLVTTLTSAVTGTDSILATVTLLGRLVH